MAGSYEYRLFEVGAGLFWTPLRFPGQYYDAESDLFENWNRYYDPSIGRYLAAEPALSGPSFVATMAQEGHTVPAYAYALDNPVSTVDPDGLAIKRGADCAELARYIKALDQEIKAREDALKRNRKNLPFCKLGGKPGDDQLGHYLILVNLQLKRAGAWQLYLWGGCGSPPPGVPPLLPLPITFPPPTIMPLVPALP